MSKKMCIFIAVIAIIFIPFVCFADNTGGADWDNDLGGLNGIRNYGVGHGHQYANTQRAKRFAVGLGGDFIFSRRSETQNNLTPLVTTLETRWDIANKNGGAYLVGTWEAVEVKNGIIDLAKSFGRLIGIGRGE